MDTQSSLHNQKQQAKENVEKQYSTGANLTTRIGLHERFSTSSVPWPSWVFEQIPFRAEVGVLEVGTGTGWLWSKNAQALPASAHVMLTDASPAMISHLRSTLSHLPCEMNFEATKVEELPFPGGSFDIAIANHMLYLVEDRQRALGSLARVLRDDGVLITTTNGSSHLREMNNLAEKHLKPGHELFGSGYDSSLFNLENAREQLRQNFGLVEFRNFEDSLVVTEASALVDYVASMSSWKDALDVDSLRADVEEEVAKNGHIMITKESGMFLSSQPCR
jgi:ubiquinone/menaquinone biosynthesis C-methylase UbiE